jgi:hypothetical protein
MTEIEPRNEATFVPPTELPAPGIVDGYIADAFFRPGFELFSYFGVWLGN